MTMCHPSKYAIISHHNLHRLNNNPFMRIAQVLNPIKLIEIPPRPVRYLPELFCYVRNIYDYSFLKVFIMSQLILKIFWSFCFSVMSILNTPNITPKAFTFFSIWYIVWSYPTSLLSFLHLALLQIKIKDSILSELSSSLLTSCLKKKLFLHSDSQISLSITDTIFCIIHFFQLSQH